ncbi:MAG TPA: hypothetical protein VHC45_16065 [Gaiellaceae bacterium]|nr:hypothetical protein [Gaiellaceae bacterium]
MSTKQLAGASAGIAAALALSVSAALAATNRHEAPRMIPPDPPASAPARLTAAQPSSFAAQLARARAATAEYADDLARAKADGYRIITPMIPNMGYHFMNPKVQGFDVRKPQILVYEHQGTRWQLGALEWVFTKKPAQAPLPGARYGSFGAGCHYTDGTFVPETSQAACPATSPETKAAFTFWHPTLITMHVWLWYPNPSGLFASTNPLAAAFNRG